MRSHKLTSEKSLPLQKQLGEWKKLLRSPGGRASDKIMTSLFKKKKSFARARNRDSVP